MHHPFPASRQSVLAMTALVLLSTSACKPKTTPPNVVPPQTAATAKPQTPASAAAIDPNHGPSNASR